MTMVVRLVRDYVSRTHTGGSLGYVFLTLAWYFAAAGYLQTPSMALALSLVAASVIGPAFALAGLAPREVQLLPVSRRELWLATCLAAVLIPTIVLTAAHATGLTLAALGTRPLALSPASITLTAVAVAAWCGAEVALLPFVRGVSQRLGSGRAASALVGSIATLGFVVGPLLPLLAYQVLPVEWDGLTAGWALVLVACLAAAAAAFMHRPPVVARTRPASPAIGVAAWPGQIPGDRLTGRARLVAQTVWQNTTLWGTGIAAMAVAVVAFDRFVFGADGVRGPLEDFGLLPFAIADGTRSTFVGFLLVIALGRAGNPLRPPLRAHVRQLRVLPMSTTEVAAWIVGRGALEWTGIWTALLVLQLSVGGLPATLLLEWLLFLVGIDALICSVQLRWERPGRFIGAAVFVSIFIAAGLSRALGPMSPWLIALAGLLSVILAWRLIADAIRHSRVPYRLDPPRDAVTTFGVTG